MRKAKKKTYVAVAFFAFLIAMTFQNCGQNLETEESASSLVSKLGEEGTLKEEFGKHAAFVSQMPFAFEAGLDTIVYNSCLIVTPANSRAGLFTIKAGAYSHVNAGLRIKPSIIEQIKVEFNNEVNLGFDENLLVKRAIYYSPANKESKLNLAFRDVSFLAGIPYPLVSRAANPMVGVDYVPVLGDVTDDRILDDLLKANGAPLYFSRQPVNDGLSKPRFEAEFVLNSGTSYAAAAETAKNVRDLLTGTYVDLASGSTFARHRLAATFSLNNVNSERAKVAVSGGGSNGEGDEPIGRTYELNFGKLVNEADKLVNPTSAQQNNLSTFSNNYFNQLVGITEYVHGQQVSSDWVCDNNETLKIVREEDRADNCPAWVPQPYELPRYQAIRQVLPADLWDINLARRCAVPKGFKCYGTETYPVAVSGGTITKEAIPAYNIYEKCHYPGNSDSSVVNYCSEYISFCHKRN